MFCTLNDTSNCAIRKFQVLNKKILDLPSGVIQIFQNLIFEIWNLTVYPAVASTSVLKSRYTTGNSYFSPFTTFLELFASYNAVSNKRSVSI